MTTSTPSAPVRRGRRVTLAPATVKRDTDGHTYLVTGRDLRYEGRMVPAGVEIPGAASWFRVEAWVDARRIRVAAPGEDFISYAKWVKPHLEAEAAEAQRQADLVVEAAEKAEEARVASLTPEEREAEGLPAADVVQQEPSVPKE